MTYLAAMEDEPVMGRGPLRFGHNFHQLLLDFLGSAGANQPKTICDAKDVRVNRNSSAAIGDRQNDVGRLSSDSGQRDELIHRTRDFATESLHELAASRHDVLGLGAKESAGVNVRLQRARTDGRERVRRRKFCEQLRCHHVHARIRALGG